MWNSRMMGILLILGCLACSGKKQVGDGDTDGSDMAETDLPVEGDEDGEITPVPCTVDSDCTDGDPCNGNERCDPVTLLCAAGTAQPDGVICSLDPRRICLAGACSESLCGDGFLDPGTDEFCEPPGEGDCDGDCLLICEGDPDCTSDGNVCNGQEYCNLDTSRCSRRDRPEDGLACSADPRGICLGGLCTDSICGDGFLDAGGGEFCEPPYEGDCDYDCQLLCGGDPDCTDDGDPCNGIEFCSVETSRCGRRDPAAPGTVCLTDPRSLCLAGLCRESICGDGFLDAGGGEYCEPPYGEMCDGDCQLLCGGDPDCLDDGEICNGEEYCDLDTSRCSRRNVPPAGTECDDHDPRTGPDLCDGSGSCVGEPGCVLSGAVAVDTGPSHACVVTSSGGLLCWGNNMFGSLGDGTSEDRGQPTPVSGLDSGVAAVATGDDHTCALTDTGGVKCWGMNGFGQVGDGTTTRRLVPTDVVGLASGVVAIDTGSNHSCAVMAGGGLKCWGLNGSRQLGDGTTQDRSSPVDVVGLASAVTAVTGGGDHTCALLDTGEMQCWGRNNRGQLGDGTVTMRQDPTYVVGLSSSVATIDAMGSSTCATLDTGAMLCWGWNIYGTVGDGTNEQREIPSQVSGLTSGVTAMASGNYHTCAVLSSGAARCWGHNVSGQAGDGTRTTTYVPVDVIGLASGVTDIATGVNFTCAVLDSGEARCWGNPAEGKLGDGTLGYYAAPVEALSLTSAVSLMDAGWDHVCLHRASGELHCWGSNDHGEFGVGTTISSVGPSTLMGLIPGAPSLSAGSYRTCMVMSDGAAMCWGDNSDGAVGDGTTTDRHSPTQVTGLASGAAVVSTGGDHSCAVTAAGAALCWGDNFQGDLGDGTGTNSLVPVAVSGLGSGVRTLRAGSDYSCAVTSAGAALCWGASSQGQLGNGSTDNSLVPSAVTGLGSGVADVAVHTSHTCARLDAGGAWCWGYNYYGQLGDGTTTQSLVPVEVSGLPSAVTGIGVGHGFSCALTSAGAVLCWGYNAHGELGDGSTTDSPFPTPVSGLSSGAQALAVGDSHACALTDADRVVCWGRDTAGQVTTSFPGIPRPVVCE